MSSKEFHDAAALHYQELSRRKNTKELVSSQSLHVPPPPPHQSYSPSSYTPIGTHKASGSVQPPMTGIYYPYMNYSVPSGYKRDAKSSFRPQTYTRIFYLKLTF